MDEGRVIGIENGIPWRLPEDLKRFSQLTKGHAVLMGRKTYESLPPKYRPLPERLNLVVSRTLSASDDLVNHPSVQVFASIYEAIEVCRDGALELPSDTLWIIGGSQVYQETMAQVQELYVTRVKGRHQGDAYFPDFEKDFKCIEAEPHPGFSFERHQRVPRG